ncbi:MAG: monovalent cation/H+ antiporter subunit D [Burkholderiales bacterium]|nr:monovalent cation/H+ antiporter subunit D [Burkholderiales bacterium]
MTSWADHLAIVPVVLPLATGALLLLVDEQRHALKGLISLTSSTLLLAASIGLVQSVDAAGTQVYRLGAWPAPFGIVLVADRLSAVMVLLAAILGTAGMTFALARWHRAGPRFHVLLQYLLVGLNGAFLTGDVFNLFVFFELLLAASYALALHGSGTRRVRASLHYIIINLAASLLFLIGASLLYAVAGTLNMADLAQRASAIAAADRALFEAGAALLGVAFLVKAAMWPLCFWLPGTYAAAAAPVAATFAILSKVGVYAVLRTSLLLSGEDTSASAGFAAAALVYGGLATLTFGVIGVLASQHLTHVAGFSLLVSAGTLLAAIGAGHSAVTAAALYYLVVSTLGVSALYLLIELVERSREPGADVLAVTAEAFGDADQPEPEEEVGIAIPAATAILGVSFAACALVLAGLPPLPGFLAKFSLLSALLAEDTIAASDWAMMLLLTLSGLAATIAMGRAGVRIFWAPHEPIVARVRLIEIAPVALLLALCISLTLQAGTAMRYFHDAAQALHAPRGYIEEVMRPR